MRSKEAARLYRERYFKGSVDHTETTLTEPWTGKRMPTTYRRDYLSNLPDCITPVERLELKRRHDEYFAKYLAPLVEQS